MLYRLYLLNEAGEIVRLVEVDADDDDAATVKARSAGVAQWELLQGTRLVAVSAE